MNSSKIVGSHISNSDMPGANLYNNDLTGKKVSEETLKDTILYKTVMPPGKLGDWVCKR